MRVYLEEDEQFGIDIVRDGDDIYYRHVLTNSLCQEPEQALAGFSERDRSENEKWDKLLRRIEDHSEDIEEWLFQGAKGMVLS